MSLQELISLGGYERSSFIKSVQRGTFSSPATGATATLQRVVPANCLIGYGGVDTNGGGGAQSTIALTITNETTLTITTGSGTLGVVPWQVIEFHPGVLKRVQSGTASLNAGATINAVDLNRTWLVWNGFAAFAPAIDFRSSIEIHLSSPTAITSTCFAGSGETVTARFTVAEF